MIIQLNTDRNISGTEELESFVSARINSSLKHFTSHISRMEVHFSDQNADKGGPEDILCKLEARVEHMQPLLVKSSDESKEKALAEALEKMKATLNSKLGKRNKR